MKVIKVLVIDDSAFMRKMITNILESDQRIEVLGTARNGKDGLHKISQLKPDVVTLDVEMPVMDGLMMLEKMMEQHPLPAVILSSITTKGAKKTLQALDLGAIDFIEKPSGPISLDITNIETEIVKKVIAASQANFQDTIKRRRKTPVQLLEQKLYEKSIVAIGASTGGPKALQTVLTQLPKNFPAPIFIVQHMPPNFTKSLAKRLDSISNITVKEATHGELVQPSTAYIAPGDYHMEVKQVGRSLAVQLSQTPLVRGHRPAVDVLFHSLRNISHMNKIGIVLTGMGRDGAEGIKALKERDENTIIFAESETSSIVYGMPAAAVKTGYVNKVLHIEDIGHAIVHVLT